ncbi:uncharacterized protein LOC129907154 [Episyrphus balteatus]|uniref:uncharacterized protein LOC129907154 n=1 Tax=Episyrphus balteatus TaxID=286459 RepID=UPI002486C862|nr:uncharacterized protein LOC129907154 [Episyrphus balteatus]
MKNSTIWESASRPLFVKSVWLEGGYRHFILDHKPKQRLDAHMNLRNKSYDTMQTSVYCDFSELNRELLLVGSSKAQCHQNFSQLKIEKNLIVNHRRLSSKNLFIDHFKRRYDLIREEAPSKRSSLHDISSVITNNSHSDEKLAERVLNWLDLAGKTPLLRPIQVENISKRVTKEQHPQKLQPESACSRRNDSIKHITIIFNKEGVPVRLNRPVRNIDLCAVSSSAGVARRLAGNLASARLYGGNVVREIRNDTAAVESRRPRPKTSCTRRNFAYNGIGKKKTVTERENSALRDAKRQLHIFMPSLPKKTMLSEDTVCSDLNKISVK